MIALAPAKVNLTLEILSKDKDGYHYIRSLFDPVSLYDIIEVKPLKPGRIIVKDVRAKLGIKSADNIVYKAARLLKKEFAVKKGASIRVHKYIPDGAGLGGGSSDAAAVIKSLVKIWGIKGPAGKIRKAAFKAGADVPFFIKGKPAVVSGKGEIIKPVKRKKKGWYVIVCPDIKVPTGEAYGLFDKSRGERVLKNETARVVKYMEGRVKNLAKRGNIVYNSFETVIINRHTKVARVKKELSVCGPEIVSLSGSGAAVFALFENRGKAYGCYRRMAGKFGAYFRCLCHSI